MTNIEKVVEAVFADLRLMSMNTYFNLTINMQTAITTYPKRKLDLNRILTAIAAVKEEITSFNLTVHFEQGIPDNYEDKYDPDWSHSQIQFHWGNDHMDECGVYFTSNASLLDFSHDAHRDVCVEKVRFEKLGEYLYTIMTLEKLLKDCRREIYDFSNTLKSITK